MYTVWLYVITIIVYLNLTAFPQVYIITVESSTGAFTPWYIGRRYNDFFLLDSVVITVLLNMEAILLF